MASPETIRPLSEAFVVNAFSVQEQLRDVRVDPNGLLASPQLTTYESNLQYAATNLVRRNPSHPLAAERCIPAEGDYIAAGRSMFFAKMAYRMIRNTAEQTGLLPTRHFGLEETELYFAQLQIDLPRFKADNDELVHLVDSFVDYLVPDTASQPFAEEIAMLGLLSAERTYVGEKVIAAEGTFDDAELYQWLYRSRD